jgi:hypothetical protein
MVSAAGHQSNYPGRIGACRAARDGGIMAPANA